MPQRMEELIEFTGTEGEAYYSAHRSTMSEKLLHVSVCVYASYMCIRVFACICIYLTLYAVSFVSASCICETIMYMSHSS